MSQFPAASSSPSLLRERLTTEAPLLPKVRGQFAEFLNRGSLVHLRRVLLAYRCRFAVRAHRRSGERLFWAAWGYATSARLRRLVPGVMALASGFAWMPHFPQAANPVHSVGSRSLPRPPFALDDPVRCRTISPACHRLRLLRPRLRSRLTLGCLTGPRNPQAFGVCGCHTDCATHSGIRSCACSTCPPGQASPPAQRSPTIPSPRNGIHSFGTRLKPRYVVGAAVLDQ